MSSSDSVLKALSSLVDTQLNYVCLVAQKNDEYYLCLGRHQFFFLNCNLSEINAEIYYAHLDQVLIDKNKGYMLQLNLTEGRPENVPEKLVIKTGNRQALLDQIKTWWKTDCLFRMRKVKKFPLIYGTIIRNVQADPFLLKKRQPAKASAPPTEYKTPSIKGYIFFIHNCFQNDHSQIGLFHCNYTDRMAYVQISDTIQISYINLLKERKDIRYYCENIMEYVVKNDPYWKILSQNYNKKSNLTSDKAQWQGWECLVRTATRDIHIIILRRKYIPPMMDSFQDFVFIYYGKSFEENDLSNPDNNVKMQKKQQFLTNTKETVNDCRAIADSVFFNSQINKIYDVPVSEICNALILDEEGFQFCQNKLNIMPDGILYAILYLEMILTLLKSNNEQFEVLLEVLHKKYDHVLNDPDPNIMNGLERQEKLKEKKQLINKLRGLDNPAEIIDYFVRSGMLSKQNNDPVMIRYWRRKVARYVAYAINGGLLNGQFTIKNIINMIPNLEQDINLQDMTLKVIDYLLFLTSENSDHQYKRLKEKAQRMNEEIMHSDVKYIYNAQIMYTLLEEGYIQQELLSSEQPTLFPKFLINLLNTNTTIDLKISICRQVSQVFKQAQANNSMNDNIKNAYKQLISPLMELYKTNNKLLAAMAADALLQLSVNNNDVKLVIIQEGGGKVGVEYLEERDLRLLGYSLKLVNSLIQYDALVEGLLARKLIQKLVAIIQGTGIPGTYYQNDVILLTFNILNIAFPKADENQQALFQENIDFLFDYILLVPDYILTEITKSQIFTLLNKIINKFDEVKVSTNKKLIPFIIQKINDKSVKNLDLKKSIIHFLLNDLRGNEIGVQLFEKNPDVINNITDLMKEGDDTLMLKCKTLLILHFNVPEVNLT